MSTELQLLFESGVTGFAVPRPMMVVVFMLLQIGVLVESPRTRKAVMKVQLGFLMAREAVQRLE